MGVRYDGMKLVWLNQAATSQSLIDWVSPPAGDVGSFIGSSEISVPVKVRVINGPAPTFTLDSGTLPPGTVVDPTTGTLYGTLGNANGSYTYTLKATSGDVSTTREFSANVVVNGPPVWSTPAGTLGSAFDNTLVDIQLTAVDPEGLPVTYMVLTGSLPRGLKLDATTGKLSGRLGSVPDDTTFFFTIRASDGGLHTDRAFSYTTVYNAPPVWQTPAYPDGGYFGGPVVENKPFSATLLATDATGGQTVTYTLIGGSLPVGFTLNSVSGVIDGTAPAVPRDVDYPFTVSASDGYKATGRTFRIGVKKNVPPVWLSSGQIGQDFGGVDVSYTVSAYDPNGESVLYSVANGSQLPDESFTLNSTTGVIAGTMPDVSTLTDYNFTLVASDGVNDASRALKIRALKNAPPVWVTGPNLGHALESTSYSRTLIATDQTGAGREVTYTALSPLPGTLTLSLNGVLSGTLPSVATETSYTMTIRAGIGEQLTNRDFTLTVDDNVAPIWVTPSGQLFSELGKTSISYQLEASDPNMTPVLFTLVSGSLPNGITMSSGGLLSGILPDVANATTYNFTVALSDGVNMVNEAFSIEVRVNLLPVWDTPAGSLGSAFESMPFTATVAAHDPENKQVTYLLAPGNILPYGLSLNPYTGTITGTLPGVPNDVTTNFTILADDGSANQSGRIARAFSITTKFNSAPVWVSPTNLGTPVEQRAYSYQLAATGVGNGPMVYTLISGALPTGLTLSKAGMISGMLPASSGLDEYNFTINAFNGIKGADQAFTLSIAQNIAPVWNTAAGSLGSYYFNNPVNVSLSATDPNGTAVAYSVVSGALPAGLSLVNGTISGILTTRVQTDTTASFTIRASDGVLSSDRAFSITTFADSTPSWITPAGSIGSPIKNKPFSFTLQATDPENVALTYTIISGGLPSGLAMNSSTGVISGTTPNVTDAQTSNFTVRVSDGIHTADRAFSLTVNTDAPPVWSTPSGSLGSVLSGYPGSFGVSATDPESLPLTYTMTSGTLPPNMSFDNGSISTGAGQYVPLTYSNSTYTFTVEVSDGNTAVPRTFSISVLANNDPIWTTPAGSFGTFDEGTHISNTVVAVDPNGLSIYYSITSGTLPTGLNLDTFTGVISGTIGAVSTDTTYNFDITAADATGATPARTTARSFSYTVRFASPPAFQTAANLGSQLEQTFFTANVVATANGHPITYTANTGSNLPPGLTLNANTGTLSGTLGAVTGDTAYNFTIRATDLVTTKYSTRTFSLTVLQNLAPVWITPAGNLFNNLAGVPYSVTVSATDPNGTPVVLSFVSGSLPTGGTFDANTGVISGTLPAVANNTTYSFTLGASDGAIRTDRNFSITSQRDDAPVWVTNAALPDILENKNYSYLLVATDPNGKAVTYSLNASTLPGTLTLASNGLVYGVTPSVTSNTTSNFTVDATDGTQVTSRTFSLTVLDNRDPVWVTNAGLLGEVTEGVNGSFTLVATDPEGGPVTYATVNGTSVPAGMTLYTTNGVVRGSPLHVTSDTITNFDVRVTDNVGNNADRNFSINVKKDTTFLDPNSNAVVYLGHYDDTVDPYWANVVVYQPFDGDVINFAGYPNGGNGVFTSSASKYGTGSVACAETSSAVAVTMPQADLANLPFTAELWVKRSRLSVNREGFLFIGSGLPFSIGLEFLTNNTIRILQNTVGLGVSTATVADLNWHHIALVSNGTAVTLFIDGVSQGAAVNYYDGILKGDAFIGGAHGATNFNFLGNLDDIRMTVGVARYTSNFTPAQIQMPLQDYYGTPTVQVGGLIPVTTTFSKFGAASVSVTPTTSPAVLSSSGTYGFNSASASDNFTIEGWIYPTVAPVANATILFETGRFGMRIRASDSKIEGLIAGTPTVASANTVTTNTWHHVAIVGNATTMSFYMDGLRISSGSFTRSSTTVPLYINGDTGSNRGFTGYIDEVRLTNAARYNGATYDVPVSSPSLPKWTTVPGVIATGPEKTTFTANVVATDPYATGITYSVAPGSSMPNGVTLANTGLISGSYPTSIGSPMSFSAVALDGQGNKTPSRTFSITPTVTTANELAFSWRFNRPAGDTSYSTSATPDVGTLTAVTAAGGPTFATVPGTSPGSASDTVAFFNGATSSYSNAGTTAIRALVNDFTFETWIYTTAQMTNVNRYLINVGSASDKFTVYYNVASSTWKVVYNGTTMDIETLNVNTWRHLAIVKSGTTLRAYINGTQVGSTTVATPAPTFFDSQALTIGNYNNGAANGLNSLLNTYVRSMNFWSTAKYTETFTPAWDSFYQPYWTNATTVTVEAGPAIALSVPATTFGNATVSYSVSNGYTMAANGLVTGPSPVTGATANVVVGATDQYNRVAPPRTFRLTGAAGDQYYANTTMLLHAESLTDNGFGRSSTPMVLYGSAAISTAQSKFGSSSFYFPGAAGSFIRSSYTAPVFGSQDFTIELNFFAISTPGAATLFHITSGLNANTGNNFGFYLANTRDSVTIQMRNASDGNVYYQYDVALPYVISLSQWHHLAIVKNANTLTIYLDGTPATSIPLPTGWAVPQIAGAIFQMGAINIQNFEGPFNGYLDEVRVTMGVARYIEPFTPPTSPHGDFQDVGPSFAVKTQALSSGYKNGNISLPVVATSNSGAVTYTLNSGTLPGSTTLASNGTIIGPLANASNIIVDAFAIKATDVTGRSAIKNYTYTTYPDYDPYFNNVAFLMRADDNYGGKNTMGVVYDSSNYQNHVYLKNHSEAQTIPTNITSPATGCRISNSVSKFGGSSLYIPGVADSTIAFPTTNPTVALQGLNLSNNNFTMEAWVYPTSLNNSSGSFRANIMSIRKPRSTTNNADTTFIWNLSGPTASSINAMTFEAYDTGSTAIIGATASGLTIPMNAWTHVAITRVGATLTTYVNGVAAGAMTGTLPTTATTLQAPQAGSALTIGGYPINADFTFNYFGYMDELRITNGVARYTGNFTPTGPVPSIPTPIPAWTSNAMVYRTTANSTINGQLSAPPATVYTLTSGTLPDNLSMSSNGLVVGLTSSNASTSNSVINAFSPTYGFQSNATLSIINAPDPYLANTISVLRANPTLRDSMGILTWSKSGNAAYTTAGQKTPLNNGALSVGGIQNDLTNYFRSNARSFALGTQNWTIEFKSYINTLVNGADGYISNMFTLGGTAGDNTDKRIHCFYYGTGPNNITGIELRGFSGGNSPSWSIGGATGVPITTGNWHHVALQRSGNVFSIFINGVLAGSTTSAISLDTSAADTITLGLYTFTSNNTHGYQFNGYLDDFRMTVGQARYTAPFSPPDAIGGLAAPSWTTNSGTTIAAGYTGTALNTAQVTAASPLGDDSAISYSITSGSLPAGIAFNANGVLTGTFTDTTANSITSNVTVRAAIGSNVSDRDFVVEYVANTPADPSWSNVAILTGFTGANGANAVASVVELKSGRPINAWGGVVPTITTTRGKWGASSVTTAANSYIGFDNTDGVLTNAGDFTMEGWFYKTAYTAPGYDAFFGCYTSTAGANDTVFYTSTTGVIAMHVGSTPVALGSVVFPLNQWVHIAWTRAAGVNRFYVNGAQIASNTNFAGTLVPTTAHKLTVGGYTSGGNVASGHIGQVNDFRYTKSARYTGTTYTVPTKPFPKG